MGKHDKRQQVDKAKRREGRTASKALAKKRRIKAAIIIAASVAVVVAAMALVLNTNAMRRTLTVVSVNGRDFSVAEFEYFATAQLAEHQMMVIQMTGELDGGGMLPIEGVSLRNQLQDDFIGRTWAEFVRDLALRRILELSLMYSAAVEYGFELDEAARLEMEEEIEMLREDARGLEISFERRLRDLFGRSMNERVLAEIQEFIHTAVVFEQYMRDFRTFTAAELDEFYEANTHLMDNFTYRFILMRAHDVGTVSDFDSEEEFEEARQEARAWTSRAAVRMAEGITTQADFIIAAREHDPENLSEPDSTLRSHMGELLGPFYGEWMRDESRSYGDMTTVDVPAGSFVLYFIERDDNTGLTETGERARDVIIEERLRTRGFSEWQNSLDIPELSLRWTERLVQYTFNPMQF
ncbi:MAG: hypothetical protein FWB97_02570 [Oscillospiraceae bacterium]|nr:hypothetical protein [Oscillospiraceae bacterium]